MQTCDFFAKTGSCKYGHACHFHHPVTYSVKMNTAGLPIRPNQQACPFYERTGGTPDCFSSPLSPSRCCQQLGAQCEAFCTSTFGTGGMAIPGIMVQAVTLNRRRKFCVGVGFFRPHVLSTWQYERREFTVTLTVLPSCLIPRMSFFLVPVKVCKSPEQYCIVVVFFLLICTGIYARVPVISHRLDRVILASFPWFSFVSLQSGIFTCRYLQVWVGMQISSPVQL